jgi:Coenzyme PQQ synthesis protein D (PqqD)
MGIELPTLGSRVEINDDVLFQPLQGEAVLLNLKSGIYFGLDPIGTRIWQLFSANNVLSGIAETIVEEYDVTPEQCKADLLALVSELEKQGLVKLT